MRRSESVPLVGRLQRALPGEGLEVRLADLHLHGAGRKTGLAQTRAPCVRSGAAAHVPCRCRVGEVVVEGLFGADRLFFARRHDRPIVDARCAFAGLRRVAPEDRFEDAIGASRRSPTVRMPDDSSRLSVSRPMPGMTATGSGSSVSRKFSGDTTTSPSGLSRSEAILATSLFAATPTDAVSRVCLEEFVA